MANKKKLKKAFKLISSNEFVEIYMHFDIEDLKKYGFLWYGFSNYYATAEAFWRE